MNFYVDVVEKLQAAGVSIHHRFDAETSMGEVYWCCWCGPLGKWDVEVTQDRGTPEWAWLDALDLVIDCTLDLEERLLEEQN